MDAICRERAQKVSSWQPPLHQGLGALGSGRLRQDTTGDAATTPLLAKAMIYYKADSIRTAIYPAP